MPDPAPRTEWHDTTSVRTWWAGAPADNQVLVDLLEVAKGDVIAYAPALAEDATEIPTRYPLAQYRRAREMWESSKTNVDDAEAIAMGGLQLRVARMSGAIKYILRPDTGVPGLG